MIQSMHNVHSAWWSGPKCSSEEFLIGRILVYQKTLILEKLLDRWLVVQNYALITTCTCMSYQIRNQGLHNCCPKEILTWSIPWLVCGLGWLRSNPNNDILCRKSRYTRRMIPQNTIKPNDHCEYASGLCMYSHFLFCYFVVWCFCVLISVYIHCIVLWSPCQDHSSAV